MKRSNLAPAVVFFSVGLLTLSALGFLVTAHKGFDARGWPAPLFLAALALGLLVWIAWRKSRASFRIWLVASVLIVFVLFAVAEAGLRTLAVPAELGARIGETTLFPLDWERARQTNIALLNTYRQQNSLYEEDALLGWDVAKSRTSANGLYHSSAEGIRSDKPGETYATGAPQQRIALIGDSFTFAEEVPFEQTWGQYLEQLLAPGAQVLNFGVTSHGVDQTLLKFDHKVRPWKPRAVIFGLLNGAAVRSGNVYLFLRPEQELPFSKPRFVLQDGKLRALNLPALEAERIFTTPSVAGLPLLEHEALFSRTQWQASAFDFSYAIRYLFSRFPKWELPAPHLSDDANIELTTQLIAVLAESVERAGATLLIVFLPVRADIAGRPTTFMDAIAARLASRGRTLFDPTDCLLGRVSARELFVDGGSHYSSAGNYALAQCLAPQIVCAVVPERLRSL